MATITTRSGKGAALTHAELDANFTNLNTDKVETSLMPASAGTQEASKIVQADANVNIGATKVTSFYIGASGSETQVTSTAAELNYLDLTTGPGTQEANKAVVADANTNTGISKVTELHIGASGSETKVTSTASEINYLDLTTGPGTQEASKAVVADANTNIGATKVTSLSIGTSGSETTVASTATELDQKVMNFQVTLGTADDQHIVIPWDCDVTAIYTVIDQALTTTDETLTFKNNAGTAMTGGVVTITQAGSADGDIDSATPSANNSFTAGQKMTVSIGGENGTAVVCNITVLMDIT